MEQQFGIRELSFGGSFYWFLLCKRFAMTRALEKTRKNRKIQEKSIPLSLFFSYFLLFFLIFLKPPKA